MEQNIAFERCVDFLARMIEKYGQELLDEIKEETISPTTIASIFEAMDDLETLKNNLDCERLKYIPGVISRKTWSELLKIGFIQTQDIPNYDVAANHALGNIIQKLNIA